MVSGYADGGTADVIFKTRAEAQGRGGKRGTLDLFISFKWGGFKRRLMH